MTGSEPSLVAVDDLDDPRLFDYRGLRDVQLRTSMEAEHGLFVAEGEKVITRAVDAGYQVRSFLMARRWVPGLADRIEASGAPCYVMSEDEIERVTGFHVHRGALASMHRPAPRAVSDVLTAARRVVVLEDVVDHTNVGAIFRSAAAFGIEAVLLSPRCADPLYRRSIKVAMGAVFDLPYARLDDWYHGPDRLAELGFRTLALTPDPDAVPIARVDPSGRLALLMGTEGAGLSPRWLRASALRVRIPISPMVDSLNVAAATAVACYELTGRDH